MIEKCIYWDTGHLSRVRVISDDGYKSMFHKELNHSCPPQMASQFKSISHWPFPPRVKFGTMTTCRKERQLRYKDLIQEGFTTSPTHKFLVLLCRVNKSLYIITHRFEGWQSCNASMNTTTENVFAVGL